jgi:hypothetical protein
MVRRFYHEALLVARPDTELLGVEARLIPFSGGVDDGLPVPAGFSKDCPNRRV